MRSIGIIFISLSIFLIPPPSAADVVTNKNVRLSEHMLSQLAHSLQRVLQNFVGAEELIFCNPSPALRGLPGAIIAAPCVVEDHGRGEVQDYMWRWKRDAAIVMRFLVRIMTKGELDALSSAQKFDLLQAYVHFCEREQLAHKTEDGFDLGHAKVTLFGDRNLRPWGYPQNDGPPLETIALLEILKLSQSIAPENLEFQQLLSRVLERNVIYMLKNYDKPSVERWEEVKAGSHFSVLAETYVALNSAVRASRLLEPSVRPQLDVAAIENARGAIAERIRARHLQANPTQILSHVDLILDGSLVRNKASALDTQVLMTSIAINKYWEMDSEFFYPPSHPLMRATFQRLRDAFAEKYVINQKGVDSLTGEPLRGVLFGRYPEDGQHFGGAPWFITTLVSAQYLLWDAIFIKTHHLEITDADVAYFRALPSRLPKELIVPGKYDANSEVTQHILEGLIRLAKEISYRVMVHTGDADLSLTEVINPLNGFKEGIQHLSWSYVEFIKLVRMFRRAQYEYGLETGIELPVPACETWLNSNLRQQ